MDIRILITAMFLCPLLAVAETPLETLLRVLPPSETHINGRVSAVDKSWEDWQRRTGELPPDFDHMPSMAELPDPLLHVTTPAQWEERRHWIRSQFEHWVFGTMPPKPDNLRAEVTATRQRGAVTVREVRLEFGPDHKGKLRLQLLIPPGKGPFPVFLVNHPGTPWVTMAVRRGYIACTYFAGDPNGDITDDSDAFIEVYPDYDFSSLGRRAWAGMRAVDYLSTLPEVDKNHIGITGHSRDSKQALLAAAFDKRIAAVVASSGNTGECGPWRYTSEMFANESIERITGVFPQWFHPRLRFFTGREQKLPVDQNSLMALVAPRGLLMYSAYSELEGNPFGHEQSYRSVRRVYRFTGHPDNVGLHLRFGEHAANSGDIESFLDFFDTIFGRKVFPHSEDMVFGYTFDRWKELSREQISAPAQGANVRDKIRWALGEEPAGVTLPPPKQFEQGFSTDDWLTLLYPRPLKIAGAGASSLSFGEDLHGDFYYPADAAGKPRPGKWPTVIWLHEFNYQTGYSARAQDLIAALVQRGYAVLAFDQIGFGTRIRNSQKFYERYPKWSLMGKMVADTRGAVEAVAALDQVDSSRIYLAGYALGGKVALWTAALEPRVKGAASVAGFTLLRAAHSEQDIEGIRMYSHLHGLLPRFGFYVGQASRLPIDYDEILGAIAPRPVLVVAPTLDRYAPVADVQRAVDSAKKQYAARGSADALQIETPVDFNRFPEPIQMTVVHWLESLK